MAGLTSVEGRRTSFRLRGLASCRRQSCGLTIAEGSTLAEGPTTASKAVNTSNLLPELLIIVERLEPVADDYSAVPSQELLLIVASMSSIESLGAVA